MYLNVLSVLKPQATFIKGVSVTAAGAPSNAWCANPDVSSDGRYVVFTSSASNLVDGDTNEGNDIFRKDLVTGEIVCVSRAADGTQANAQSSVAHVSADGRYVLFTSQANNLVAGDTNNLPDVFRKDLLTGAVIRISTAANGAEANGSSDQAYFSSDGRYVVFRSFATNLVGGDTNNTYEIFRKDTVTGEVIRVATAGDGTQGNNWSDNPKISADGHYAVFLSGASNLVAGDTNNAADAFRKNLETGEITRISIAADGTQPNSNSSQVGISANGRYAVFHSSAGNLVAGDTNNASDVFRKDLTTGEIVRVSTAADGTQANSNSDFGQITADGRYVTFRSAASNLVAGDTNNAVDIFRKDLTTGEIIRVSTAYDGTQANSDSDDTGISSDGRYAAFRSGSTNLIPVDTNNDDDVFLVDVLSMAQYQSQYGANLPAIAQGRYVEVKLGVGTASKASIAWGDGTFTTEIPTAGTASFSHAYASTGSKNATVILVDGALTWNVAHTLDVASSSMARNLAVADTITGGGGGDTIVGDAYANILIGEGGNDSLTADAGNDTLNAGSGNDRLNGSTGNDRLVGGTGRDTLTGGSGRDVFAFDDRETSASKGSADYIYDFSGRGGDKIDLRAIDANTKRGGDQNFSFIGTKAFGKAGEVRYEKVKGYTYVYLNTDSDKAAEAVLKIKGAFDLQKSWFVL